jgi:hypothetical protein
VIAPVAVPVPTVKTNTAPVIVQPTVSETTPDLTPAVPRIKQAQVIGVVRELVRSGCIVKKVATTDGIHYSQLIVTCDEAQAPPAIQ